MSIVNSSTVLFSPQAWALTSRIPEATDLSERGELFALRSGHLSYPKDLGRTFFDAR